MIATYGVLAFKMETEAAARSLPEACSMYVEEKRHSDNEGIRLKANCRQLVTTLQPSFIT